MIVFVVQTFEVMRAWFILFHFKIRGISLEASLVTLSKMAVMFEFVWTIALDIF